MPSSACYRHLPDLHSFPTRRSSDLAVRVDQAGQQHAAPEVLHRSLGHSRLGGIADPGDDSVLHGHPPVADGRAADGDDPAGGQDRHRSEEHTSELQSRLHLVCRLLLATATSQIYTLSLHDALPIWQCALTRPGSSTPRPRSCTGPSGIPASEASPTQVTTPSSTATRPSRMGGRLTGTTQPAVRTGTDRKSTRLNSSHGYISYAVFCLLPPPPRSTLFPYTTLFRSGSAR